MTTNQTIDGVSRELIEHAIEALTRHLDQHAPMQVPPSKADSDLVREELRALLDAKPEDYPPCDYCGIVPSYHPWHGSGALAGVENPHIHACNECRHLMPASQPRGESVTIEAVAVTRDNGNGGLRLEWLLEGGISQMEFAGMVLFAVPEANDLCDEDGSAEVYLTPPKVEHPAPVAVVPDGYCIMPRQLTAENGAKALLLGEFKLLVTKECPECCELQEPTEGCSICDGEGEFGQKHTIPWDQIKYIYSKAVSGLAMKTEPAKSR